MKKISFDEYQGMTLVEFRGIHGDWWNARISDEKSVLSLFPAGHVITDVVTVVNKVYIVNEKAVFSSTGRLVGKVTINRD